jgi:hypothetical protein
MRKLLFLTTLLIFILTSSVWAADISGNWNIKMKDPMGGDESFNIAIKQAGENLTVTTSDHPKLKEMAGTGTLKGDAVTMSLKIIGQKKPVEIVFTGKVAGNKITGTREIIESGDDQSGQGSAPDGGASAAIGGKEGALAGGGQGSPPSGGQGGQGGAPAGEQDDAKAKAKAKVSKAFTAEKK